MRRMLWVTGLLALAACEDSPAAESEAIEPSAATPAAEENAVYECPMHCKLEGQSEPYTQKGPGECPVCGMDLKPKSGE